VPVTRVSVAAVAPLLRAFCHLHQSCLWVSAAFLRRRVMGAVERLVVAAVGHPKLHSALLLVARAPQQQVLARVAEASARARLRWAQVGRLVQKQALALQSLVVLGDQAHHLRHPFSS